MPSSIRKPYSQAGRFANRLRRMGVKVLVIIAIAGMLSVGVCAAEVERPGERSLSNVAPIDDFKTPEAWRVNPDGGMIHMSPDTDGGGSRAGRPSPYSMRLVAAELMLK